MRKVLLGALAALTIVGPASAAVVTRTYSFTATGFTSAHGSVPPVEAVIGSVTVRFDPTVSADHQPGVLVNSVNVPVGGPLSFSYRSDQDTLAIMAGAADGRDLDAFALTIRGASANDGPLGGTLRYSTGADEDTLTARAVAVTPSGPPARLPEPATWGMLVTGFGLIGWLARRHQRRSERAFTERLRRIAAGEIE